MNGRHVAPLVVLGWYLIVPPMYEGHELEQTAPLGKWPILESFDTAKECKNRIVRAIDRADRGREKIAAKRARSAVCVASDDPRLAK